MGKTRWVYAMGVAQARGPEDPIPLESLEATLAEVGSPREHLFARPGEAVGGYFGRSWLLAQELLRAVGWAVSALTGIAVWTLWRRGRPLSGVPRSDRAAGRRAGRRRRGAPRPAICAHLAAYAAYAAVVLVERWSTLTAVRRR